MEWLGIENDAGEVDCGRHVVTTEYLGQSVVSVSHGVALATVLLLWM